MAKPNENQVVDEIITGKPFKERAEGYQKDLEAISKKWSCQLIVTPVLVPTNHGSFEIAQRSSIGELPKN